MEVEKQTKPSNGMLFNLNVIQFLSIFVVFVTKSANENKTNL